MSGGRRRQTRRTCVVCGDDLRRPASERVLVARQAARRRTAREACLRSGAAQLQIARRSARLRAGGRGCWRWRSSLVRRRAPATSVAPSRRPPRSIALRRPEPPRTAPAPEPSRCSGPPGRPPTRTGSFAFAARDLGLPAARAGAPRARGERPDLHARRRASARRALPQRRALRRRPRRRAVGRARLRRARRRRRSRAGARHRRARRRHHVRIAHFGGMVFTQYFHLAAVPRGSSRGARVAAGDVIGLLGDTGLGGERRRPRAPPPLRAVGAPARGAARGLLGSASR